MHNITTHKAGFVSAIGCGLVRFRHKNNKWLRLGKGHGWVELHTSVRVKQAPVTRQLEQLI